MSIAQSLLEMAVAEAERHDCHRLARVRVICGALSGIMPDALQFCFENLVRGTPHEGCILELEIIPLRLRCSWCGEIFGGEGQEALFQPCPRCGEDIGHIVEQGRELLLGQLEAAPAYAPPPCQPKNMP